MTSYAAASVSDARQNRKRFNVAFLFNNIFYEFFFYIPLAGEGNFYTLFFS